MNNLEKWEALAARIALAFILIMLFLHGIGYAGEKWDRGDKVLLGVAISGLAVDCMQTLDIYRNPIEYRDGHRRRRQEDNPIIQGLGENGVVPYFVAVGLLTYYGADHLHGWKRKALLVTVGVVQAIVVTRNGQGGIQVPF